MWSRATFLVVVSALLSACSPGASPPGVQQSGDEKTEQLSGAVIVRDDPETGDLLAAVDLDPQASSGSGIDRVFVLQRESAERMEGILEFPHAEILSSRDAIVIRGTESGEVVVLTLSGTRTASYGEVGTTTGATFFTGYGLSRREVASDHTLASIRSELPRELGLRCDRVNERGFFSRASAFAAILIGPGEAQPYCQSGGQGSNSCSTGCIGGSQCTVNCEAGYYACCDNLDCSCKCVKKE